MERAACLAALCFMLQGNQLAADELTGCSMEGCSSGAERPTCPQGQTTCKHWLVNRCQPVHAAERQCGSLQSSVRTAQGSPDQPA